jgi:hypothetical protein
MRASVFALLACCIAGEAMAQQMVVPDAPDLMVKTRRIEAGHEQYALTEVLYLKGARQRRETVGSGGGTSPRRSGWLAISQCDERRSLELNTTAKLYAYRDLEDPAAYVARVRKFGTQTPPPPPDAPVTKVTIDSTDTGERRPFGSYTARHVITTRTTEPPAGAHGVSRPTVSRQDGWYIDVPDMSCWESGLVTQTFLAISEGPHSYTKVERRGNGRAGYPIEETFHETARWGSRESKLELVEMSEAPLDDALFTAPKDYQPALQTPYGPEMSTPDTILNRLSWYGNQMVGTVWRWFNPPASGHGY